MPLKLPKGWAKTTLSEVCLPVAHIQPENSPDTEFTYFDIGGIDNQKFRIVETKTITGRSAPSRARQLLQKNDILFSTVRTYLRKIAQLERDYPNPIASTGFVVIRAAEGVSSQFLFFQVLSEKFLQPLHELQTGTSYPAVRARNVFAQSILLPPTSEQERIVAKLDTALSRLERAEKAAQRAKERLKRYHAAVLHSAVTGEITRDWRETHKSSETGIQLLQRLIKGRRERWEEAELERLRKDSNQPKGDKWKSRYCEPVSPSTEDLPKLPAGWTWASLDQLGELNRGKSKHRPRDDARLYGGSYPFIQTGDIRRSKGTIREHTQTYSEFGLKQSRLWPKGTLCITIAANIAETGILTYPACFPDSVVGFVQDDNLLKVRFVEYFIRSEKAKLERYAPATAQKNINLEILSGLTIPVPPLDEQTKIVQETEHRLAATDRLLITLEQQLERARATHQSLLSEAFAGHLVSQDPNDEPASTLLERIRATREAEAKKPKGKRMSKSKLKATRRPLLDVLREHKKTMTPEMLFRESGFEAMFNESEEPQDVVDAFYKELRNLTDLPAKVSEQKDSQHVVMLKVLP